MNKIRIGIIGSGWRALFYLRIAQMLPDQFEVTAVLTRDSKKGEQLAKSFQISVVQDLKALLKMAPDYVVLSIKRGVMGSVLKELIQKGVPTLCETPPGETIEELIDLWDTYQKYSGKVQVAEQYFLQPLYAAWEKAVKAGMIGEAQNISISALHGYHGVSMMRRILGIGYENAVIYGKRHWFDVTETYGRDGVLSGSRIFQCPRERLTLEFENGCIGYYDFSDPAQYHSFIRTRQLNIQGTRGEIDDLTIRYLNKANLPVHQTLTRIDLGVYNNQEWSHQGLMLGEDFLYQTPFPNARLNDDEIAVASCMKKMGEYISGASGFYEFKEAIQDMYLCLMMNQALEQPNHQIKTMKQCWAE